MIQNLAVITFNLLLHLNLSLDIANKESSQTSFPLSGTAHWAREVRNSVAVGQWDEGEKCVCVFVGGMGALVSPHGWIASVHVQPSQGPRYGTSGPQLSVNPFWRARILDFHLDLCLWNESQDKETDASGRK